MGNVYSLLGHAYILPTYRDRKSRRIQFEASLVGCDQRATVGFVAPFGLVLHRSVYCEGIVPNRFSGWTISESRTGCRVVGGRTRQDALDALAERVAYVGGEAAFERVVQANVTLALETALTRSL